MQMTDLIEKKKQGKKLLESEIKYIINNYSKGVIPDYQMSALAMAIFFKGMDDDEIVFLTESMRDSGEVNDLTKIEGFTVDKHSSGGVGDKISFIYGPLAASFGLKVFKMSGRGLGITGGTIDKLESIPGFKLEITLEEAIKIINKCNMVIMSQSENMVPADKKLYALRDVTATVNSIPLISASIMSKKLATNADGIVLDVKCGDGAFMKDIKSAKQLATLMVKIGKKCNKKITAEITNMDQPLGRAIGNSIEVYEAIKILKGESDANDLIEIAAHSTAVSLVQSGMYDDEDKAYNDCLKKIKEGTTYPLFEKYVTAQGGDLKSFETDNLDQLLNTKYKLEIKAKKDGFMNIISNEKLGLLSIKLGAGRIVKEENIDHQSGIYLNKITGEAVKEGDVLITLYTNKTLQDDVKVLTQGIFEITTNKPKKQKNILEVIN
ncbi:thymidine phosphorylase [Spiroplasma endosymbiont of Amphibalanus improvisus]|uniref:thymidine phosphorylase n=1 Tax=Spiroplasma endosymbiont of Amphibalanus improvisus TaxID=3066327 RepID=UPI00313A8E89